MNQNSHSKQFAAVIFLFSVLTVPLISHANPTGGVVQGGSKAATISHTARNTTIKQNNRIAVIDWKSFNIKNGEETTFRQPKNGVAINRVSRANPMFIDGKLTANETIMLLSPGGILFGRHSQVDVGQLLATTLTQTNKIERNSSHPKLELRQSGPPASIINNGVIKVRDEGWADLVSPGVENNGLIQTRLGGVSFLATTNVTIDLYGDGLINFSVAEKTKIPKRPNGSKMQYAANNTGRIIVDGGYLFVSAKNVEDIVDHVINIDGVLDMHSAGMSLDSGGKYAVMRADINR